MRYKAILKSGGAFMVCPDEFDSIDAAAQAIGKAIRSRSKLYNVMTDRSDEVCEGLVVVLVAEVREVPNVRVVMVAPDEGRVEVQASNSYRPKVPSSCNMLKTSSGPDGHVHDVLLPLEGERL